MKFLEKLFEKLDPIFEKGGRLHLFYPLYEALETFAFVKKKTTTGSVHLRDATDFKRMMMAVVYSLIPCVIMAMYNTGFQANQAMQSLGQTTSQFRGNFGIQAALLNFLHGYIPFIFDASNIIGCLIHGAVYFIPIYAITMTVGGLWEVLFAIVRKHEVNEGFFVTGLLFPLTLPATIPYWQVAAGISFGVIIGKEVFGGTGRNFMNPALCGRAYLFFAHAAQISGDNKVWIACDGISGATPLTIAKTEGVSALAAQHVSSWSAFLGTIPGSMGETSTLACLIGLLMLCIFRVASLRIMASILGTVIVLSSFFLVLRHFAGWENPALSISPYWHFVLGGMAFGTIFMATDPVTAAMTKSGQIVYGIVIATIVMIVRVFNPAYPEGMMLAILFGNVTAPLIDHFVVAANIKRRQRRLSVNE
ncbi:MAG: NADH:ubiquinone reductase (Na(+)-transporting) subunit B [Thermoguttaceae bacterium]